MIIKEIERQLHYMTRLSMEEIHVWFINGEGALIHHRIHRENGPDEAAISLRDLFQLAEAVDAVAQVLVHNHPQGDPTPSRTDEEFTSTVYQYGKLCEVFLVDHLIVGGNTIYSFAENIFRPITTAG